MHNLNVLSEHTEQAERERENKNKSFNIVPYAQQKNPNWSANLIFNSCSKNKRRLKI